MTQKDFFTKFAKGWCPVRLVPVIVNAAHAAGVNVCGGALSLDCKFQFLYQD